MPNPANHRDAGQDSETLRVFCLGQFRVFRGSVELQDHHWGDGKGPTQKIKALFAFLLCRKEQGARKETLTDLLWPRQTDPKRASSSFHQALFHLRRALEPDLKIGAASSYIRCRGDRYFFSPLKPCWVDADLFFSYAERAQALEAGGDSDAAIAYWSKAIGLYGGDYMAGINAEYTEYQVDDWCAARCCQLRQLYLAASMAVARYKFDLGQCGLAVEYARQALSVEPALEPAHRLVMQCLLETGYLDGAICQYRACKAELARREDRAPSEQTRMLYQRLLENY
ncbi:MAG: bacterial transcriptional activator domain-containing protein [Chloroflexi bacterium]|nr:bacterial transcriptional activator domain-containing protein [Chloroflexota bacterium]